MFSLAQYIPKECLQQRCNLVDEYADINEKKLTLEKSSSRDLSGFLRSGPKFARVPHSRRLRRLEKNVSVLCVLKHLGFSSRKNETL